MKWSVPPIWDGGEVWIIGGGPSVPKQFDIPEEVVQRVTSGVSKPSAYSPYFAPIHDKHIIGINIAYLIGNWIDMIFFGDINFYNQHEVGLAAFPGLKICCHKDIERSSWVKYLARDMKHPKGISSNRSQVSWNFNSGAAAISIAANSGAKRIILLGFDMKLDMSNKHHWHGEYRAGGGPPEKHNRKGRMRDLPFDRHLKGFPEIARDACRRGIEILNASPDSAIRDFKRCSVKDILCGLM